MPEELDLTSFVGNTQLDDVLPDDVTVTIVEFKEEIVEVNGVKTKRRKPYQRRATISTYVPMSVFHKMLKSQDKIRRFQALQQKNADQMSGDSQTAMMAWMTEQVFNVWVLTEPDMTIERLEEGLQFQKVMALFGTFFGDQLKALNGQAQ